MAAAAASSCAVNETNQPISARKVKLVSLELCIVIVPRLRFGQPTQGFISTTGSSFSFNQCQAGFQNPFFLR